MRRSELGLVAFAVALSAMMGLTHGADKPLIKTPFVDSAYNAATQCADVFPSGGSTVTITDGSETPYTATIAMDHKPKITICGRR